jgi:hypothetical protein
MLRWVSSSLRSAYSTAPRGVIYGPKNRDALEAGRGDVATCPVGRCTGGIFRVVGLDIPVLKKGCCRLITINFAVGFGSLGGVVILRHRIPGDPSEDIIPSRVKAHVHYRS